MTFWMDRQLKEMVGWFGLSILVTLKGMWQVQGPVLFMTFTSDLEELMEHTFVKFSGDTKFQVLPVCRLRADLPFAGTLIGWKASRNHMKSSKDKYKVLHLRRKSPVTIKAPEDRARLFTRVCCRRIRHSTCKLLQERFRWSIRKTIFPMMTLKRWSRLLRKAVNFLSVEFLGPDWTKFWATWFDRRLVLLWAAGWAQRLPGLPSSLRYPVTLWSSESLMFWG